jgi:hypothetical protein
LPSDYEEKPGQHWPNPRAHSFVDGAEETIVAQSVREHNGVKYLCVGWKHAIGDVVPTQGTANRVQVTVTQAGSLTWIYKQAFEVSVEVDPFVHKIWKWGRYHGLLKWISVATDGSEANFWPYNPSISSDGRFVAFQSKATNLVADDTNGRDDIYVQDRQGGTNNPYLPSQLWSEDNLASVSTGSNYTMVIRQDGSLWARGDNQYGQLGLGDTVNYKANVGCSKFGKPLYPRANKSAMLLVIDPAPAKTT